MPVCTFLLLSLNASIPAFVSKMREGSLQPLIIARVVRWIITPTKLSKHSLLDPTVSWHLMLIFPYGPILLPLELQPMIRKSWSIQAGVPSKLINSFETKNEHLLHPTTAEIPPLTGSLNRPRIAESAQGLELSQELQNWIMSEDRPNGAVSMLNLLAFQPGKKGEYMKYGQAFAESVGSLRGGVAKIVGRTVSGGCSDDCGEWDEVRFFRNTWVIQSSRWR